MVKKDFIIAIKKYTDDYISHESFKNDKWEHYSDEAWGEIYNLGNVYHTDQLKIRDKYAETRKLSSDNDWFINWVKLEFEQARHRGIEIELHILGAIIQKNCCVGPNGYVDGGWIRYIKIKK